MAAVLQFCRRYMLSYAARWIIYLWHSCETGSHCMALVWLWGPLNAIFCVRFLGLVVCAMATHG